MKIPFVSRRRLRESESRLRERIDELKQKLDRKTIRDAETRTKFEKEKVFCVGLNKTGTTSVEEVFVQFGFSLGNLRLGENLIEEWATGDFDPIIKLCHTADAFQDCPFSLPFTFVVLDRVFPNARFVLTVRDSAEQWWSSLTRFHSKMWADGERVPTREDLENADYIYKGRPWRANRLIYGTPEEFPYDKQVMLAHYERHNRNVMDYFRHRPEKLCVINVSKSEDYQRLCRFLGKEPVADDFPWLNKT